MSVLPVRTLVIVGTMFLLSAPVAIAQFVPVQPDGAEGEAAQLPNLKMLKRLPSAPFSQFPTYWNDNRQTHDAELGTDSAVQDAQEDDQEPNAQEQGAQEQGAQEQGAQEKGAVETAQDDAVQDIRDGKGAGANQTKDAWLAFNAFQRGQYLTAMELALPRAQLGDPAAQTLIAELFVEGFGVSRNMDDAIFWYDQAAKSGDASAQYKLALLLADGKYIARNEARARELMKQAAFGGHPAAQFNYAQLLVSDMPGPRGLEQALPFFERAASRGIPDAHYAVSQIYLNELNLSDEKRALARQHLIAAARAGYDTAQVDLAIWLIDGIGGERDFEAGFQWMQLAAVRGNVIAQNRLAHLYIQAIGTGGDPVEAAKWYITSRRAGLEDPNLEDFYQGLTIDEQKQALDAANKLRF